MTVRKLKPRPQPASPDKAVSTQLRLLTSHWQDATADLQMLRYNHELLTGALTKLQANVAKLTEHGGRLVEHCERLLREKQALLHAQRAEDETPHRLDMLQDDVDAIQRQIGRIARPAGGIVWHEGTCASLLGVGPCNCRRGIQRQAG